MSSSSSSRARASESGGRDIPWVLLDRTPRLTDFGGMDRDADVLLELVPPPAVSTAFLDHALLPAAAAWDTAPCRVEGADASGHLLLAFPSPRAPGESNLLVCRPVPSSSGGAGKAKGKGHFLPAFPEDVLGLAISPAAPTGIIADHGANTGDAYFVAQVQSAPSSTPVVAVVLCFSSDESKWTVREVAGDDRWRDFHAKFVVSHDRGVHGDGLLVFVDRKHGLLLFHPRAIASRFVQFPDPPEGGGGGETEEEADASVDSSEGKIIYVVFYDVPDGTMIGLWCLSEENLRWNPHFNLCSDEVFHCDERLLPLQGVRSIGPVDPYRMTRMVFAVRCPADGTFSSFCVEVTPAGMVLRRVQLLGDVESCACLDSVVCPLQGTPKRSWMETVNSAVQDGKQVGMIALSAVQKGRKYVDKLPGAVQLVGGALGLSHTSALVSAANAIKTVNDSITIGENVSSWFRQRRPGAPGLIYKVVGTEQEAQAALDEWLIREKPSNMLVDPAEDLTPQQWDKIRTFFVDRGAETLVQHYAYELVGRPPR